MEVNPGDLKWVICTQCKAKLRQTKLNQIQNKSEKQICFAIVPRKIALSGRTDSTFLIKEFQKAFLLAKCFSRKIEVNLTENVLNQWKIIKNITNCGLQID